MMDCIHRANANTECICVQIIASDYPLDETVSSSQAKAW